jgi:hypothetical protein
MLDHLAEILSQRAIESLYDPGRFMKGRCTAITDLFPDIGVSSGISRAAVHGYRSTIIML